MAKNIKKINFISKSKYTFKTELLVNKNYLKPKKRKKKLNEHK